MNGSPFNTIVLHTHLLGYFIGDGTGQKQRPTKKMTDTSEGVFGSDNLTSAYLEPVTSEAEIDYSLVYALFTFVASMEGQISVLRGEPLELLDDSNSYW